MTRKKIFETVSVSNADDRISGIYNKLMLVAIIASIVPMAFKEETTALRATDQVTVLLFIVDYAPRWITADYNKPKQGSAAFALYPATP